METVADRPRSLLSVPGSRRIEARAPELALLRFALALVFVWFGLPKLVPGLSPAEDLVRATVPWFDSSWFVPLLGAGEAFIGLCFLRDRWLTLGLLLLAGHMVGTALPLFTLPDVTWKAFPVATLEGQYVLKNAVLVAAAFAVACTHLRRATPRGFASRTRCAPLERTAS